MFHSAFEMELKHNTTNNNNNNKNWKLSFICSASFVIVINNDCFVHVLCSLQCKKIEIITGKKETSTTFLALVAKISLHNSLNYFTWRWDQICSCETREEFKLKCCLKRIKRLLNDKWEKVYLMKNFRGAKNKKNIA